MSSVIEFFKGIGEAIVAAFDFLISFFEDLVYVIKLLGKFILQIPSYFSWLPAELLIILSSIIAIVVIYKIMGREG